MNFFDNSVDAEYCYDWASQVIVNNEKIDEQSKSNMPLQL